MLPVIRPEVECAHLAFKLIETKVRSTTGEDHLNALVLLYYHKGIPLTYEAIIDMYAQHHPRRMFL